MPLQTSGQISLNDVNVELGNTGTAQIGLGDSAVRGLFGVASGEIGMDDGYGAFDAPTVYVQDVYPAQSGQQVNTIDTNLTAWQGDTVPTASNKDIIIYGCTTLASDTPSLGSGATTVVNAVGGVWYGPANYRQKIVGGYRIATGTETINIQTGSQLMVVATGKTTPTSVTLLASNGYQATGGGGYNWSSQGSPLTTVTRNMSNYSGYDAYFLMDAWTFWQRTKGRSVTVGGSAVTGDTEIQWAENGYPQSGNEYGGWCHWYKVIDGDTTDTYTFSDGRGKQSDNVANISGGFNLLFGINF